MPKIFEAILNAPDLVREPHQADHAAEHQHGGSDNAAGAVPFGIGKGVQLGRKDQEAASQHAGKATPKHLGLSGQDIALGFTQRHISHFRVT